jgi:RNA polymerase sigma-70 factor (family 1)
LEDNCEHIDKDLVNRVAEGDQEAFAALFTRLVPLLRPGIWKLVQSEDVFREIMQEAFLKVWLHRDQLPGIEKPVSWIYRIASNECFNWLNREAKRHQQSKNLAGNTAINFTEQYITLKDTQKLIESAIAALPPQKRTIYLLNRSEGLKTIEIAEKLNISHSYVRNTISEALKFIRQYLKEAGQLAVIATLLR